MKKENTKLTLFQRVLEDARRAGLSIDDGIALLGAVYLLADSGGEAGTRAILIEHDGKIGKEVESLLVKARKYVKFVKE